MTWTAKGFKQRFVNLVLKDFHGCEILQIWKKRVCDCLGYEPSRQTVESLVAHGVQPVVAHGHRYSFHSKVLFDK